MNTALRHQYRQLYSPTIDRTPRWLRRLWLWF
jgi:hypothetical protein